MPDLTSVLTGEQEQHHTEGEYRVFGPPGAGKTNWVMRQIANAYQVMGDRIMVCSFSKAGAAEIANRNKQIPADCIRTMHAHCLHALGCPPLTAGHEEDWNRVHPEYGIRRQTSSDFEDELESGSATKGEQILNEYQSYRGRMIDRSRWPLAVVGFAKHWEDWKKANGLMDFTDLVETCYHDVWRAPGNPDFGIIDEAQDSNRLEMSLFRRWGELMRTHATVGDEDQQIYAFRGSTIDAFLHPPLDPSHKLFLRHSFRLPRAIHAFSQRWVKEITMREPKEFYPRDFEGEVRRAGLQMGDTAMLRLVEKYLAAGKSVMMLCSCSYLLTALIENLRGAGLPFHNPFRVKRGDWNPLRQTGADRESLQTRALSFLNGRRAPWTAEEIKSWVGAVKTRGLMTTGWEERLEPYPLEDTLPPELYRDLFRPEVWPELIRALEGETGNPLDFFTKRLLAANQKKGTFLHNIVGRYDVEGLVAPPRIVVGTIHSTKGSECDVVFLDPSISARGHDRWVSGYEGKDEIRRLYYVGMTRPRESLVITDPTGKFSVPL